MRSHPLQVASLKLLSKVDVMVAPLDYLKPRKGLVRTFKKCFPSEPSISHTHLQLIFFSLLLCSCFFKSQSVADSSGYLVHRQSLSTYHVPDTLLETERTPEVVWPRALSTVNLHSTWGTDVHSQPGCKAKQSMGINSERACWQNGGHNVRTPKRLPFGAGT